MKMKITDYIDQCIENFANLITSGEGWIAEDDVLRQFTSKFQDFESPIFDKEHLKKYIIEDLKNWYGVEVRTKNFLIFPVYFLRFRSNKYRARSPTENKS